MKLEPYYFTPYKTRLSQLGFGGRKIRKVPVHGGFTCPNLDGTKGLGGCTYCDNRSFSPVAGSRRLSITHQLTKGTEFFAKKLGADGYIAYFQPFSGTYAPVTTLERLYEEALRFPNVVGLSVGTRPDCLQPETLDLLDALAARVPVTLELGLQSAFDVTLERIRRGHTFSEFAHAMNRSTRRRFDVCVHVILGLPGEGPPHFRETASVLGRWDFQGIKIHPLHVVKGTVLAMDYQAGRFQPLDRTEYISGLADFLERLSPEVAVQRLTGDAPKDLLVTPTWCRQKGALQRDLQREFIRRGTCQGSGLLRRSNPSPDALLPMPRDDSRPSKAPVKTTIDSPK